MKVKVFIFFIILVSCFMKGYSQKSSYTSQEHVYDKLFLDYKQFLVKQIQTKEEIFDTASLKFVLLNYLVSDFPLDSTDERHFKAKEIPEENFKTFKEEYLTSIQFFAERNKDHFMDHLQALPIRLSTEKYIYQRLTDFQKQNTFVFFDDRHPNQPLGFMLFIPSVPNKLNSPRIWSWTLEFAFGVWAFKSPMGLVGVEYLFSNGVEGPPER